jgi:hypothetical protein
MPPASNHAAAGDKINLVFSLGGDQGLDIFAPGSPISYRADCTSWAMLGPEKPTHETRKGLTYKANNGRYTYPWKTKEAWDGTCRVLVMRFKDGSEASARFHFPYVFSGFEGLKAPPKDNSSKAGKKVDLTFSLDGFEGMDVFAAGYPASRAANCASFATSGPLVPTTSGGFSYKASKDQYTYTWNTPASFAGTCRVLIVRFDDGTEVSTRFKFTN